MWYRRRNALDSLQPTDQIILPTKLTQNKRRITSSIFTFKVGTPNRFGVGIFHDRVDFSLELAMTLPADKLLLVLDDARNGGANHRPRKSD